MTELKPIRLTEHAEQRCRERYIHGPQVIKIIERKLGAHPERWPRVAMTIRAEGLEIVYSHGSRMVLTVIKGRLRSAASRERTLNNSTGGRKKSRRDKQAKRRGRSRKGEK